MNDYKTNHSCVKINQPDDFHIPVFRSTSSHQVEKESDLEDSRWLSYNHQCFYLSYCLKYNAYDNDDGRAAEGETAHSVTGNKVQDHGEYRDKAEEDCADKCYSVKNLGNIVAGRLTGADTGNGAAVLFQII